MAAGEEAPPTSTQALSCSRWLTMLRRVSTGNLNFDACSSRSAQEGEVLKLGCARLPASDIYCPHCSRQHPRSVLGAASEQVSSALPSTAPPSSGPLFLTSLWGGWFELCLQVPQENFVCNVGSTETGSLSLDLERKFLVMN